ncbi:V-type ATP synthase subunit F [Peptoniphilus raoultii]|uniref:V-type ATP synthase subunit F n=1 Tax=Peptoniphilus raoultii TaxID=1776387 RepID=UPI0008D8F9BD|nr:V-type ATP synthase subunit F [Peptoniphilus raoultii]
MKSLLLTDSRDIVTGLRLAGIMGIYCKDKNILKEQFLKASQDKDIGIIILTAGSQREISKEVLQVKKEGMPLIVTIPDFKNDLEEDFIIKYIRNSIGIKIS